MSLVWLVTGSSRRFGRALAEGVLAEGHQLVATTHHPSQLADLVERYGDRVRAVALDVTDERGAREAVTTALSSFGRLDVLVNNAGSGDVGSREDASLADFFSVINLTKAAIPQMCRQRAGRIIQLSSIGERRRGSGESVSSAASWGIEGFSEELAQAVELHGIKVTIVAPNRLETRAAGDPARAAAVIIGMASVDEPPLRIELDVPLDEA